MPCAILEESIEFRIHGCTPLRVFHGNRIAGRLRWGLIRFGEQGMRERVTHSTIMEDFGFGDVGFGASDHGVRRNGETEWRGGRIGDGTSGGGIWGRRWSLWVLGRISWVGQWACVGPWAWVGAKSRDSE